MTTKLPSKVTPAPPIPALQVPYMVAYHGVDGAQHQQRFNGLVGQGYRILSCSIYGDPASPRYAFVWVNRPGPGWRRSPSTAARPHVNETATTYQADFDAETQLPFRPSWVSRAADGSYASVFRDDSVGDWVARHELPAAQYQAEFDTQVAAGRIPISVQGGGTGSATRYARA